MFAVQILSRMSQTTKIKQVNNFQAEMNLEIFIANILSREIFGTKISRTLRNVRCLNIFAEKPNYEN